MSRDKEPLSRRLTQAAFLLVLLPILIPLVVIGFGLFLLYRCVLYALVWMLWLPSGKDTLVIYSDSPIWHDYMTQQILPLVQQRAMVLNWSERKEWNRWSLPAQVFGSFGDGSAFNPMVILFRPFRRAAIFRFFGMRSRTGSAVTPSQLSGCGTIFCSNSNKSMRLAKHRHITH